MAEQDARGALSLARQEGKDEGQLEGKVEALLRLLTRAGIALTEHDRARIQACSDAATPDRWLDNVRGARSAADVLVS